MNFYLYCLIDKKGNEIIKPTHLLQLQHDFYRVSSANLYGYMDKNGQWLIPPKFEFLLEDFDGNSMLWNQQTQQWECQEEIEEDDIDELYDNNDEEVSFEETQKNTKEKNMPKRQEKTNSNWLKPVFIGFLFILYFLNPSESEHKDAVKDALKSKLLEQNQGSIFGEIGTALGVGLSDIFIEGSVSRDNYLFFSLTKFKEEYQESTIGIGILGQVIIFDF